MKRFSNRAAWDLSANAIHERAAALRAQGRALVDLTETNPTAVGLGAPDAIAREMRMAAGLHYAPEALGRLATRRAIAMDCASSGVDVDANAMFLSASTSEAYAWIFKLLCNAGEEVLVPKPSYPLFAYLAGLESVRVATYELAREDGFRLDVEALSRVSTSATRAVVVVHPNNPTGTLMHESDAQALEEWAAARDIAILSDEVFRDFLFAGVPNGKRHSFAGDRPCLTFVMGGLSKSCAAPGLKLAFTTLHGPDDERRGALARLEVIADTFLSTSMLAQLATPGILTLRRLIVADVMSRVRANLAVLDDVVARLGERGGIRRLPADGGWCAILGVPRVESDGEWVRRLLRGRRRARPSRIFSTSSEMATSSSASFPKLRSSWLGSKSSSVESLPHAPIRRFPIHLAQRTDWYA